MEFEWDEDKNKQNIAKHGISFDLAKTIFDGFTVDSIDSRFVYGEERTISLGMIEQAVLLVVVHTDRNGNCRIISARRANRKEKQRYEREIQKTLNG